MPPFFSGSCRRICKRNLCFLGFLLLSSCNFQPSQCKLFANVTQDSIQVRETFDKEIEDIQIKISGAQSLQDIHSAAQESKMAYAKVTTQLDSIAQSLDQIELADEQLKEYRTQYTEFVVNTKGAVNDASTAMQMLLEAKTEADFQKIFADFTTRNERAYNTIQALDTQEDEILEQFNRYCVEELGVSES